MCLVLLAYRRTRTRLILAANRDSSVSSHSPGLFRADYQMSWRRDLQAGGTWLGITQSGRLPPCHYHDPAWEVSGRKSR